MNKKAVFLAKRLDRIAPRRDRTIISVAAALTALCGCATVISCLLAAFAKQELAARIVVCAGLAAQAVSLFLTIKETVRNRFFSAVLLLVFSFMTVAALVFSTCYVFA